MKFQFNRANFRVVLQNSETTAVEFHQDRHTGVLSHAPIFEEDVLGLTDVYPLRKNGRYINNLLKVGICTVQEGRDYEEIVQVSLEALEFVESVDVREDGTLRIYIAGFTKKVGEEIETAYFPGTIDFEEGQAVLNVSCNTVPTITSVLCSFFEDAFAQYFTVVEGMDTVVEASPQDEVMQIQEIEAEVA